MPFMEAKTNVSLSREKETVLKSKIAGILADSFPGKTENWLMLRFESDCAMWFGGSDAPCLMLDVALFGGQSERAYAKMTAGVTALLEAECGIPADRIYVKYSEFEHWGWNGSNF